MYNSLILTRPCFTGHLPLPDAVYLQQLLCQNYDMFVIMLGCNTDPYSVDSCNTDPYATQTTAIQTPMLDYNTDPYAGLQYRPLQNHQRLALGSYTSGLYLRQRLFQSPPSTTGTSATSMPSPSIIATAWLHNSAA